LAHPSERKREGGSVSEKKITDWGEKKGKVPLDFFGERPRRKINVSGVNRRSIKESSGIEKRGHVIEGGELSRKGGTLIACVGTS